MSLFGSFLTKAEQIVLLERCNELKMEVIPGSETRKTRQFGTSVYDYKTKIVMPSKTPPPECFQMLGGKVSIKTNVFFQQMVIHKHKQSFIPFDHPAFGPTMAYLHLGGPVVLEFLDTNEKVSIPAGSLYLVQSSDRFRPRCVAPVRTSKRGYSITFRQNPDVLTMCRLHFLSLHPSTLCGPRCSDPVPLDPCTFLSNQKEEEERKHPDDPFLSMHGYQPMLFWLSGEIEKNEKQNNKTLCLPRLEQLLVAVKKLGYTTEEPVWLRLGFTFQNIPALLQTRVNDTPILKNETKLQKETRLHRKDFLVLDSIRPEVKKRAWKVLDREQFDEEEYSPSIDEERVCCIWFLYHPWIRKELLRDPPFSVLAKLFRADAERFDGIRRPLLSLAVEHLLSTWFINPKKCCCFTGWTSSRLKLWMQPEEDNDDVPGKAYRFSFMDQVFTEIVERASCSKKFLFSLTKSRFPFTCANCEEDEIKTNHAHVLRIKVQKRFLPFLPLLLPRELKCLIVDHLFF